MKRKLILLILIITTLVFLGFCFYNYYKENYEKNTIKEFVGENLRKRYVPEDLNIIHRLTYANETNGMDSLWGGIWHLDNIKFYANLHYNINKSGISNLQIFIFLEKMPEKLDKENTSLFINEYFKTESESKIECKSPLENVSYCEKFWTESTGGKKGIVVVNTPSNKFIGMCQYPRGSEEYNLSTCVRAQP